MPPRVSVLVPAYNAARYVDAAIESVERQTFGDWELVFVDDASTDDTLARARAHGDARIHIHVNERNLGMTGNWNRALSLARGELVIKLDADDVFKPAALARLVPAMDDPEVIAAGIRTLQCDESLEPFDGILGDDVMLRNGVDPYHDTVLPGHRWYGFAAMGHQLWSSCSFMVRRQFGGWDERFGCASDTELIWRLMETGKPIAHAGSVGLLYRTVPGSVSDTYRSRGWLTWEGNAANLLSLSRVRAQRPLSRSLRMHYVRLWQRWKEGEGERCSKLPDALRAKLDDAMRTVTAPPLADVLMTRLRDGVSAA